MSPERDGTSSPPGILSRKPTVSWPDGVLHHGARTLLLILVAALVTALFPPENRARSSRFEVGEVTTGPVNARIAFAVPKLPAELERERIAVRASVPPTFDVRPEAGDTMVVRLERFFDRLDSLARLPDSAPTVGFLEARSISPTLSQFELLRNRVTLETLRVGAVRAAREVLPTGVAQGSELENLSTEVAVVREPDGEERSVPRSEILSSREFLDQGVALLPAAAEPELQQLLRLILIQHLEYSFELNGPATALDRDAAGRAVPVDKKDVQAGELIVGANVQITPADAEVLHAYEAALKNAGLLEARTLDVTPFLGFGLLNLMLLTSFGLFLFFYRNEVYTNLRWVVMLVGLIVAYFGVAAVIARNAFPTELLPIAFVALAVAVLWDGRMGLVMVAVLAIQTGLQQPFLPLGASVTTVTLLGGSAAALSARAVRRRAQTWVFIAIIAAAYMLALLALALINHWSPQALGWSVVAAASNAALSAILAMGFVPIFEIFTGITTDQTLLEWADPNRSLLKRLSLESPGTYAHTINVANLAESAANAIGANGLLCRVGLYYHDVGKMLRPSYYVENQPEGRNPHDRLPPEVSAAVVKEHVSEGLRLAREAKVPEVVAAFIPEHHGTQRIGFFWEKAKEAYGEDQLNVEDFSYPGPRPRSRETAIAMLADSVESATRALQDPTPERIRSLIENIVDSKVADAQLDDSALTLREIRQIKEQFIKVLSSVYHHRIDYPQTRHLTESPETTTRPTSARERFRRTASGPVLEGAPSEEREPGPRSGTGKGGAGDGRGGRARGSGN